MKDFSDILSGLGVSAESLSKIQLGQGVVGKSSFVIMLLFIAFIIVLVKVSSAPLILAVLAVMVIVLFVYFFKIIKFAEQNPAAALLEGAHLVSYKKMDMAAQGIEPPNEDTLVQITHDNSVALPAPPARQE